MKIEQEINIEDLPATYQMIAKVIGIGNALRLGAELGGEQIYLPKLQHSPFSRQARRRNIAREYNGRNVKALAAKYRVTPRMIYLTVQRERAAEKDRS